MCVMGEGMRRSLPSDVRRVCLLSRRDLAAIDALIARNRVQFDELQEAKRALLLALGLKRLGTQTTDLILRAVGTRFGLTRAQLMGPVRTARLARPRMLAMYLCHQLTSLAYPAIGRLFARDHTTVMHAVRRVPKLAARDPAFAAAAGEVEAAVRGILAAREDGGEAGA